MAFISGATHAPTADPIRFLGVGCRGLLLRIAAAHRTVAEVPDGGRSEDERREAQPDGAGAPAHPGVKEC
jgi:hypothetical protein